MTVSSFQTAGFQLHPSDFSQVGDRPLQYEDHSDFLNTVRKASRIGSHYLFWVPRPVLETLLYPLYSVGEMLRDGFYLPTQTSARISAPDCPGIQDAKLAHSDIAEKFTIQEKSLTITSGENTYTVHIWVVESKELVDQKGLRFFLVGHYGHQVTHQGKTNKWKPETADELGAMVCLVMKALNGAGHPLDSLDVFSIGAIAFLGLPYLNAEDVPRKIIIDRGMSSTHKVAQRLFSFPKSMILYSAAYLSGWAADPEKACLDFFKKRFASITRIEVTEDHYFSGAGACDPNFNETLQRHGCEVNFGRIDPNRCPARGRHSLPRGALAALAPSVFEGLYQTDKTGYHNSLVVGGNDESLYDIFERISHAMVSFPQAVQQG